MTTRMDYEILAMRNAAYAHVRHLISRSVRITLIDGVDSPVSVATFSVVDTPAYLALANDD